MKKEMKKLLISCLALALLFISPMVANASEANIGFVWSNETKTSSDAISLIKGQLGDEYCNFLVVNTDKKVNSLDILNLYKEYESYVNIRGIYLKGKNFTFDASLDFPEMLYFISTVDKLHVKGKVKCTYLYLNSDFYDSSFKKICNDLIWDAFDNPIYNIYPKTSNQSYEIKSNSSINRTVDFYVSSNWDKNYEYYVESVLDYPHEMNIEDVTKRIKADLDCPYPYASYSESDNIPVKSDRGEAKATSFTVYYSSNGKKYGVDIDLNGGKGRTDLVEFEYNAKVTNLPTPTRTGYTFKGWTLNGKAIKNGDVFKESPKTETVKIVAQWAANTYNVTLNYNDGVTKSTTTKVTYDKAYGNIPTPKRDGYTFKGWTLNGSVVTDKTIVKTASDHTLTATWEKIGAANSKKPTVGKVKVKLTAKKKSLQVKITDTKKQKYEIQYSTSKKFKKAATKTIKTSKKKYTIKKLKANKKYYVRVRSYATYTDDKKKTQTVRSDWSKKANKKTK